MTAEFLVIGESVADIVREPGRPEVTHPGGSPANVAYGLARLGRRTTLLTELGDDGTGALIAEHLRGAGVELYADRRGPAPTPSAAVTLDESGRATYEFDIGWTLAPERTEVEASFRPRHVHFGSIAAFAEPGWATVLDLVGRLRERASVSYDPNVRAELLGDRAAAAAKTERCVAVSDIVKASDEDLRWLYPDSAEADVTARWLEAGAALVLITRGGDGAAAYVRGRTACVASRRVQVVDTVGAGDSFMSATLDALAAADLLGPAARVSAGAGAGASAGTEAGAGDHVGRLGGLVEADLVRVLERATAAAALTVSRAGANPPTAAELRSALADRS